MQLRLRLRPEATKANAPITGGIGSMVDAVVWNALRQVRSYPGVFGTTSAPKNTPGVRFIRKGRQKMLTIEKVIELLQAEYEKAKKIECVYNPLAWALYKVWKIVDSEGQQKNRDGIQRGGNR